MPGAVVVIGTSWGGLHALHTLLSGIPDDFDLPIIAVQHRSKDSGEGMATFLQECCRLKVSEAEDKDPILPGHVYIAPPDYHLLVEGDSLALSTDELVNHSRPSIDLLFETAAEAYGSGVVGVVLTGANQDGTRGVMRIKELGGTVLVQDPASAASPAMPESAISMVKVDGILPLEKLSGALVAFAQMNAQVKRDRRDAT
jgi:two-component system chemotaxis response regulator CheB